MFKAKLILAMDSWCPKHKLRYLTFAKWKKILEKKSIFASDRVLKNSFCQFLEFEQEFCLELFASVSWDLYLP